MAIWISRYSNKELQSGKYYPVGISIGTPKFPLGVHAEKAVLLVGTERLYAEYGA